MSDERREKYGRALAEDYGDCWESLTQEEREVWRRTGDAVIAVADEEQEPLGDMLRTAVRQIVDLKRQIVLLREGIAEGENG